MQYMNEEDFMQYGYDDRDYLQNEVKQSSNSMTLRTWNLSKYKAMQMIQQ